MKKLIANILKAGAETALLLFFLGASFQETKAQIANPCGAGTPTFTVNLTGQPNGSYMSPPVSRNDTCCGATNPDRCVEFVVTLDTAAVGLIFTVCNGAVPPGALYYQVNCGPPTPVGSGICVSPPYPVIITFCKPGNNSNQYCIQSVSPPHAVGLTQNCKAMMWTWGYLPSSVTWNSISPGPFGAYNNYLSCQSGCDSTWVTPIAPWPSTITYQVCGTAINGCNKNFCDTITVTLPPPITTTVVASNVSCAGQNNGTATATTTGGTPQYTYIWSTIPPQTTSSVSGLYAGTYTCTVTDSAGCKTNNIVVITSPTGMTSLNPVVTNVSCFGMTNGSATVTPTGGTAPYTYSWNPGGQTTPNVSGLPAGVYTITVTDANGCTITTLIQVTQPPLLTSTITATTNVSCFGGNNGSATVTANGGTLFYTYHWSNNQSGQTATGLTAGNYSVVVTDAHGCTSVSTVMITTPSGLTVASSTITNVNCYGNSTGAISAVVTGGNPPYTYSWNPTGQTTPNATGLTAGVYTLTVTDNNGCIIKSIFQINQPTSPLTSALVFSTNVSCFGGNNGSATVSASGGTPNYTYHWSNNQTSFNATALTAGNYSVLITDANGCTSTQSVTITQPASPLTSSAPTSTNILCNGAATGSATVNISGGTPGYTYAWNPIAPNASSVSNLAAGNYTCTTIDANGCSVTNTFTITQPPPIVTNVNGSSVNLCYGSNATLSATVTGGVPAYSYSWSPVSSNTNSVVISPTASTTYSLTVTDANGCTKVSTVPVTVYALPVAAFSAPNACLSNQTVFADSSTGATTYSWNFGEPSSGPNNISTIQNPTHIYSTAGTFTVSLIVADSHGCTDTTVETVVVNPIPSVSFTSNTVCQGNTTTFNNTSSIPTGNVTGWSWNFGDPNSGQNNISASQSPTHIFSTWGTFNVILTATSDSGCQSSVTLPVTVYPVPTASFIPTKACSNTPVYFADASTYATQWQWDFGNLIGTSTQQNPTYTYSSTGTYIVTLIVTSAGGCMDTISAPVTVDASPVPNFSPDTVCVSYATSFTDLSVAPGGSVVGWLWNFGDGSAPDTAHNPVHTYALPGTYTVSLTVTSNNGCKSTGIKTVVVYPQPVAAFTAAPTGCISLGDMVEFTDHSYSSITNWYWYFGDSSAVVFTQNSSHVFNDTGNITVTLIVQDNHGCMDTTQREVCVQEWTFYIPNAFTPNGNGKNDWFYGKGIGITNYEMWIFDRWGNLIFHCQVDDLPQSKPCWWNGKVRGGPSDEVVQEDVYVWKVKLTNVLTDEHTYIGTVTVVK